MGYGSRDGIKIKNDKGEQIMKITLNEALGITRNLKAITSKDVPAMVAYKFLKLGNQLQTEMKTLEDTRIKLVNTHSDGTDKVKEENIETFHKEFSEVLAQEIELEWEKIKIETLGDITIKADELSALELLFI